MPDVAKKAYPAAIDDLPGWLAELPGYDAIVPQLRDSAPPDPGPDTAWQVSLALPQHAADSADDIDPLVMLVMLAFGRARVDDKMTEVVGVCRGRGKTWTQIGEALGISKQAAWERYSGEE
jgi:hypothetical protein